MNVQSKEGAKASAPQLVNTDKVCVCDLVERELTKQDCVVIFQKLDECDKTGVEVNPFVKGQHAQPCTKRLCTAMQENNFFFFLSDIAFHRRFE